MFFSFFAGGEMAAIRSANSAGAGIALRWWTILGRVSRRWSRFLVVQAARLQEARAGAPPAPRPRPLHQPETRSNLVGLASVEP